MKSIDDTLLEIKRNEMILQLLEEGYSTQEVSYVFNKHVSDIDNMVISGYLSNSDFSNMIDKKLLNRKVRVTFEILE